MKLVYVTANVFPSKKVDPFFHRSMAEAFHKILGDNFLFLIRRSVPDELRHMCTMALPAPNKFKSLYYFFVLPFFVHRQHLSKRDVVLFSYDPNLLTILIFWRSVFRWKYRICSDWHQLFGNWKDSYVAKRSDFLVTTSQRLKELLIEKCGALEPKILVAYGGVDPEPYKKISTMSVSSLRNRLGLPEDVFLAGYVGGFTSVGIKKGLDTMIEAVPYLPKEVRMAFVGGTKAQIEEYTTLAEQVGVRERCIFVERQPFEKVVEYQCSMDVLVIPYPDVPHFRDHGFPLKVWEYMASGRPIIYSNLPLINEVLENHGVPFTPGNSEAFAEAVIVLYDSKENGKEISLSNTQDILQYTWEKRAQHIISLVTS